MKGNTFNLDYHSFQLELTCNNSHFRNFRKNKLKLWKHFCNFRIIISTQFNLFLIIKTVNYIKSPIRVFFLINQIKKHIIRNNNSLENQFQR